MEKLKFNSFLFVKIKVKINFTFLILSLMTFKLNKLFMKPIKTLGHPVVYTV